MKVPEIVGKSVEDALKILDDCGLKPSEALKKADRKAIVKWQDPPPGDGIHPGKTIHALARIIPPQASPMSSTSD